MTGTLAQGRLSAQNAEMSRAPRLFRLHLSLWLGLAVAVVVFLATPTDWRVTTRWAVGWDAGLVVYLVLTGWRILRIRSVDQIRARAAELDDAGAVVLPLSLIAAVVGVAVVIGEAAGAKPGGGSALLVMATLALSWSFIHLIFAQHYAHGYYGPGEGGHDRGGLLFPGEDEPDYGDFIHFALIIGVANQTADVQIADRRLRRISSLHSLTAFVFNTVILALGVNFAITLIGA